jgi:ABC-type sugar transport system ATPase subunit
LVRDALKRSGASFAPDVPADTLSVPELRLAQIARTLIAPGDVIMLDEPTAVLSESDADHLLERLLAFRDAGKAILYVSHRLSEVLRIATRVTVLRDGRNVGTFCREDVDRDRLVRLMAERDRASVRTVARAREAVDATAAPLLTAENLTRTPTFVDVSVRVRKGEIVGVAGVQGSGHGHLLRAIAGVEAYERGRVLVGSKQLRPGSVRDAYRSGVILVPADRRESAIVPAESVRANLMLPSSSPSQRFGVRQLRREQRSARRYVESFAIRPPATEVLAGGLSGGNQQKVALARALEASPEALLLEEPTQGIDVNAKSEIRQLIEGLVSTRGLAVIVATSEFEELLGLADVIYVMCLGRLVATIPGDEADYGTILEHALP